MNIIRGAAGAWWLAAAVSTTAQAQGVIVGLDGSGGGAPQVVVFDNLNPPHEATRFNAFDAGTGGASVAFGDVNGDGTADRIVGAGPGGAPRVQVVSGSDNAVVADFLAFDPALPCTLNTMWFGIVTLLKNFMFNLLYFIRVRINKIWPPNFEAGRE